MTEGAIHVRAATARDVVPWMSLASEVEPLFGPMPGIADHIQRGIIRGTALVVTTPDGQFAGGALLSRDDAPHRINWLAIREDARKRGCGRALLRTILDRWDDGQSIEVITFGAGMAGGDPARRLYARHGFRYGGMAEPGPDGSPRARWVRQAFRSPPH